MLIHKVVPILLALLLLTGCTSSTNASSQPETTDPIATTEQPTTEPESTKQTQPPTTEPVPTTIGSYTLEECKRANGVFIAYEDGSFDMFPTGGYCKGLGNLDSNFDGMFLSDSIISSTPTVNRQTKIVVFSNTDYRLTLHPIHASVRVFQTHSHIGVEGYGRLGEIFSNTKRVNVYVYYEDHTSDEINPVFINGNPAYEYQADCVEWTVNPYSGMPRTQRTIQLLSFTGDEVTFGVGTGTTLIEKTYPVNAKYFDCDIDKNNYSDEDIYRLTGLPTKEGYAEIDLSEIPDGQYALVFHFGNRYRASLLTMIS